MGLFGGLFSGGVGGPDIPDDGEVIHLYNEMLKQQQLAEMRAQQAAARKQQAQTRHDAAVRRNRISKYNRQYATDIYSAIHKAGLSAKPYDSIINSALADVRNQIAPGDTNVAPHYTSDIISSTLDKVTAAYQQDQLKRLNRSFAPGYSSTVLNSSLTDPIVNSIVNSQYGDALTSLRNALDRGTLDPTGYAKALATLGEQKTAARDRVGSFATGALTSGQQSLDTILNNARTSIGGLDLGDAFDLNGIKHNVNQTVKNVTGGLEGAILNSVGSTPLFDISKLVASGASAQGAINPATQTGYGGVLQRALQSRSDAERQRRGLGSTGAF